MWGLEVFKTIYFNIFRIKHSRGFSLRNSFQFFPFLYCTARENHFKSGNRRSFYFFSWNVLVEPKCLTYQKCIVLHWHPGGSETLVFRSFSSSRYSSKQGGITQISKVDTYTYKCDLFTSFFENILLQRISKYLYLVSKMKIKV